MKRMNKEEAQFLLSVMPRIEERAAVKERAYDPVTKQCFYRLDGDANNTAPENCCFIGYLIPPKGYSPSIEGASVMGSINVLRDAIKAPPALVPFARDNELTHLLAILQSTHDNGTNCDWDQAFSAWKKEAMAAIEEALK